MYKKYTKTEIKKIKEQFSYNPITGDITRIKWFKGNRRVNILKKSKNSQGYITIPFFGDHAGHRIAWVLYYGKNPEVFIDHINGVRDDNRICNLREVNRNGNMQNIVKPQKNNSTGFLGVSKCPGVKNKWLSQIYKDGVVYILGRFNAPEEAHQAYLKKKKEIHISTILGKSE